jgi:NAD(P)-dependent dehydrogenase (short-subunit alcohol dehydrogenase family)
MSVMNDPPTPSELFSLTGKVVLLTGASSGLGARWAPVLAAAGGRLILTARRELDLAEVAKETPGSLVVAGDINCETYRHRLLEESLGRFGRIDVLVNNAGTATSAPALDTSLAEFRRIIETDLISLFAVSQMVGRAMINAGGGSIVNIASLAAERCVNRYPLSAYNSAKSGVVALTRSLAAEWGGHGVRVNAVGPAFFPTRLTGPPDPDQIAWIKERTALRRAARIDELDGPILFLASDASTYVTGQHLLVDGGWSVY